MDQEAGAESQQVTGRVVWGALWQLQAQALSPPALQLPRVSVFGFSMPRRHRVSSSEHLFSRARIRWCPRVQTPGWRAVCGQESLQGSRAEVPRGLSDGLCWSRRHAGAACSRRHRVAAVPLAKVISPAAFEALLSEGPGGRPLGASPLSTQEALSLGAELWDWPLCHYSWGWGHGLLVS